MKKRLLALITGAALVGTLLAGCGSTSENTAISAFIPSSTVLMPIDAKKTGEKNI